MHARYQEIIDRLEDSSLPQDMQRFLRFTVIEFSMMSLERYLEQREMFNLVYAALDVREAELQEAGKLVTLSNEEAEDGPRSETEATDESDKTYLRAPEHDRRIQQGDDFAGDAWRLRGTERIYYTVVGGDPNYAPSVFHPSSPGLRADQAAAEGEKTPPATPATPASIGGVMGANSPRFNPDQGKKK